ncbi:unnamed protein product [Schistosoma rodhaini]|nr:unnamed protein product [Schistosoma rodhaini]
MAFVVLHVSAPYRRTVLTFVLKILTLVLVDNCFELQMFFSCRYAALALPIRALTSASDPPCSSMMLPRYVKVSTSSKASPSSVIGLVHIVLYRRVLLFPLFILRPTAAEAAATLVVFSCICCCVCDRRARSSAKSKSSSCILPVHCIPCIPPDVDVFIIQSITRRKRNGESRQPCLTPVFTSNESVSCPPWTIWQFSPS